MIDLRTIPIARLDLLTEIRRIDPDRDGTLLDVAPHQDGYWAAMAAGHALLIEIVGLHERMMVLQPYVYDHRLDDIHENPEFFELETRARLAGASAAAPCALSIARAQDVNLAVIDDLEMGIACLKAWASLDDEQRRSLDRVEHPYDDVDDLTWFAGSQSRLAIAA